MLEAQERTLVNARLTANGVDATIDAWSDQLGVIVAALSGVSRERLPEVGTSLMQGHDFLTFELVYGGAKPQAIVAATTKELEDPRFEGRDARQLLPKVAAAARRWIKREGEGKNGEELLRVANLTNAAGLPVVGLALPLSVPGEARRIWAIATVWQTKLVAALSAGDSDEVIVVDGNGHVLTASAPRALTQTLPAAGDVLLDAARAADPPAGFKRWIDAKKNVILGAYGRSRHAGLLVLTRTDGRFASAAARLLVVQSLLWAVLLVLIAMLASVAAARGITRNLRQLADTTVRIADGDFKAKAEVRSADEVAVLGAAVNFLGGKLDELLVDRLEKARLDSELQTAKLVQDAFFPVDERTAGYLKVAAQFKPAAAWGGGWWGHFEVSKTQHLICIGDATGHGVPAALVTATAFSAASIMARQIAAGGAARPSMGSFLGEINQTLFASGKGRRSMTLFAAFIDLGAGECVYANAGHNCPFLLRHGGMDPTGEGVWDERNRSELRVTGAPLGCSGSESYQEESVQLQAGDRILFFSDGLCECRNAAGEAWGRQRFLRVVERSPRLSVADLRTELMTHACAHVAGHPPSDDITVVAVELDPAWVPDDEREGRLEPMEGAS